MSLTLSHQPNVIIHLISSFLCNRDRSCLQRTSQTFVDILRTSPYIGFVDMFKYEKCMKDVSKTYGVITQAIISSVKHIDLVSRKCISMHFQIVNKGSPVRVLLPSQVTDLIISPSSQAEVYVKRDNSLKNLSTPTFQTVLLESSLPNLYYLKLTTACTLKTLPLGIKKLEFCGYVEPGLVIPSSVEWLIDRWLQIPMKNIPLSITTLELWQIPSDFSNIPPSVTTLVLVDINVTRLSKLPSTVTSLVLKDIHQHQHDPYFFGSVEVVLQIPSHITHFRLSRTYAHFNFIPSIKTLNPDTIVVIDF